MDSLATDHQPGLDLIDNALSHVKWARSESNPYWVEHQRNLDFRKELVLWGQAQTDPYVHHAVRIVDTHYRYAMCGWIIHYADVWKYKIDISAEEMAAIRSARRDDRIWRCGTTVTATPFRELAIPGDCQDGIYEKLMDCVHDNGGSIMHPDFTQLKELEIKLRSAASDSNSHKVYCGYHHAVNGAAQFLRALALGQAIDIALERHVGDGSKKVEKIWANGTASEELEKCSQKLSDFRDAAKEDVILH